MARKTEQFIDIANKLVDILKKNPHTSIIEEELFLDKYPILKELSDICQEGDLKKAKKFLLKHPTIVETRHFEDAFEAACLEGHLEIAKMLREKKPNVYISIRDDHFVDICGEGHFELAKWLLEVNPDIDISMNDYQSFSYACLSGNLELAELLLEKSKTIDTSVYNTTFSWVCTTTGNVKVAEWLINKCPSIDIYGRDRINFKNACKNDYLELVDWFPKIKPV